MNENEQNRKSLTVLLPAGRLPRPLLAAVHELAARYDFGLYLSTVQNLRLIDIAEADLEPIKEGLAAAGAVFKGPGKFPLPKICAGRPHCSTGIADTERLSRLILERFGSRIGVKPKFKIAVAGCPLSCSGALLADIGVVATRNGYEIYAGGKGGPLPQVGHRILRGADEERVLAAIGELVDFHQAKTGQKQRLRKLLDDPEFPFPAAN
jgi:sulfite reductase beta subunit-like hemoprotein